MRAGSLRPARRGRAGRTATASSGTDRHASPRPAPLDAVEVGPIQLQRLRQQQTAASLLERQGPSPAPRPSWRARPPPGQQSRIPRGARPPSRAVSVGRRAAGAPSPCPDVPYARPRPIHRRYQASPSAPLRPSPPTPPCDVRSRRPGGRRRAHRRDPDGAPTTYMSGVTGPDVVSPSSPSTSSAISAISAISATTTYQWPASSRATNCPAVVGAMTSVTVRSSGPVVGA
jgi:hypothetical protein